MAKASNKLWQKPATGYGKSQQQAMAKASNMLWQKPATSYGKSQQQAMAKASNRLWQKHGKEGRLWQSLGNNTKPRLGKNSRRGSITS